jgi:hypothetical protein
MAAIARPVGSDKDMSRCFVSIVLFPTLTARILTLGHNAVQTEFETVASVDERVKSSTDEAAEHGGSLLASLLSKDIFLQTSGSTFRFDLTFEKVKIRPVPFMLA